MRIRLIFDPPLTPYKCWYEITDNLTIKDLAKCILKDFRHTQHAPPKSLKLELDGFELYKRGTTGGLLKENDIVNVQLRKGAKASVESENKVLDKSKFKSLSLSSSSDKHAKRPRTESADLPSSNKKLKLTRTTAPSLPSGSSSESSALPVSHPAPKKKKDHGTVEEPKKGLKKVKETKSKLIRKGGSEKVTKRATALNKNATLAKKAQPAAAKVAQASKPKDKTNTANESDSDSSSDDDNDTSNSDDNDNSSSDDSDSVDSDASSTTDDSSSSGSDGEQSKKNASETVCASTQAVNGKPQGQAMATLVSAEKKPTRVPFGEGRPSTKKRNLRKKQKKYHERLAASIPNGTAEANPVQEAAVMTREIPTSAAPDTDTGAPTTTIKTFSIQSPPPPSLTNRNKKKGFLKDMVGRERFHIRFDGEGESMEVMEQGEQGEQGEQRKQGDQGEGEQEEQADRNLPPLAPALAPARAIITSVELECPTANGRQRRRGSNRGRFTQQERQYPVQRGPRVVVAEGYDPKGVWDGSVEHSADFDVMMAEYEEKRAPRNGVQVNRGKERVTGGQRGELKRAKMQEMQATRKDYNKMENFVGAPMAGDVIAYKVLEMSALYTPEISDFKEATLQSFDPNTNTATLRLLHASAPAIGAELELDPDTGLPQRRRFELDDETLRDEFLIVDVAGTEGVGDVVVVNWTDLIDVRRVGGRTEVDGEAVMAGRIQGPVDGE
ncbi:hypothetical protein BC937DRAFT_91053 [Endogone sp. FLAS-F59071]|nr:hypothetical protein BC937DRAFT_91053 [Endogone sp. FLAS-F59071]|eukprot:RUS21915.1 hypothetical protein BC937DRAFT_91053 [Endogone sp. FLAS-F59071]